MANQVLKLWKDNLVGFPWTKYNIANMLWLNSDTYVDERVYLEHEK